jgi:hypothetical protein
VFEQINVRFDFVSLDVKRAPVNLDGNGLARLLQDNIMLFVVEFGL